MAFLEAAKGHYINGVLFGGAQFEGKVQGISDEALVISVGAPGAKYDVKIRATAVQVYRVWKEEAE